MNEETMMEEIKAFVIYELNKHYGYVGCAEAPGMVFINSGKDKTLTIKIEVKDEQ